MREGPSKPAYRKRLQTALSCIERKFIVVSVKVKGAALRPHQVGIKVDERKQTTREASKICRDDVKTGQFCPYPG